MGKSKPPKQSSHPDWFLSSPVGWTGMPLHSTHLGTAFPEFYAKVHPSDNQGRNSLNQICLHFSCSLLLEQEIGVNNWKDSDFQLICRNPFGGTWLCLLSTPDQQDSHNPYFQMTDSPGWFVLLQAPDLLNPSQFSTTTVKKWIYQTLYIQRLKKSDITIHPYSPSIPWTTKAPELLAENYWEPF